MAAPISAEAAVQAAPTDAVATSESTAETLSTAPVSVPILAGVDDVQVWAEDGSLLATLASGTQLNATRRSADRAWLGVQTDAGAGWVQTSAVIAFGVQKLPETLLPALVVAAVQQSPTHIDATAAPTSPLTSTTDATATLTGVVVTAMASGESPALTATVSTTS